MNSLVQRLGGPRNAGIAAAGAGGLVVLYIGHRHAQKNAQNATTAATTPAGYADTALDPTQVYTGYDQLQQEISALQQQSGVQNPNPVPVSTSPGSTPPPAPTPTPPAPAPKPVSSGGSGSTTHTYTVVKGDTLWGIAQRLYGSGAQWTKLYANNKSVVGSNPNLIRPGERLTY